MDPTTIGVAFWSAAIALPQHLSPKFDVKASVSPEAMSRNEDVRGVFGVEEGEEDEERPEKRRRKAQDFKDEFGESEKEMEETEEELLRSGMFGG